MIHAENKIDQLTRLKILEHHPRFHTKIDEYLKWAPVVSLVLVDAAKLKTRHSLPDHLKIFSISETVVNAMVQPIKHLTQEMRPNGFDLHSFPSGHTATSFMGAEIIRKELSDHNKALGLTGYAMAATTAVLRLYKNKHWLSDVVAGAVIGIAAVQLSYFIFKKFKNKKSAGEKKPA